MKYLSGIHALNTPCELLTCGDWHRFAIQWERLTLLDSENSIFGDYGIEPNKEVHGRTERLNVANHIRALLDLLQQGKFSIAQGMKEDFICHDEYTEEVFEKVVLLKNEENWSAIDRFMGKEYFSEWLEYKKRRNL